MILFVLLTIAINLSTAPAYSQGREFAQSAPTAKDADGDPISSARVGEMVILSVLNVSFSEEPQPFFAIIEVRNSEGVTVFLNFQIGTLLPAGDSETGMSWVPVEEGTYEIRTFLLSSLNKPEILSTITLGEINVES